MIVSPPALIILALAFSVNLSAATVKPGTSKSRESSVTVPTITAVWVSFPFMYLARREIDMGGLLIRDIRSLFTITAANLDSALLAKKL